ncbi:kinase-like domain-containing protein [Mycena rosella]|uniref:Kinase-like domain-containing protein n=1 Tax=Mycena rosella TaxID=1033263 RepID=A0AAD7D281_MYCRO|nr:kinase-like domain-containing protein [Mycena rosella]
MPVSPASQTLPDLTGTFADEGYLQLVHLLGSGGYAKVYRALDTTSSSDDPVFYAVKCMGNGAPGSSDVAILENEFCLHKDVSHHPGVVSFHRIFAGGKDGEFVFMVLGLAAGDMLHSIVLDAVEQCHTEGVFHRDLKPQNFLCNSARIDIRLADFGMATREDESQIFRCGTLAFMSPGSSASCASLPPMLTSILHIMRGLHAPAPTIPWPVAEPSTWQFAAYRADEDNYLADAFHLTPAARDLFRWCFAVDPATRPTIPQMRAAVLNIERYSFAHMLPAKSTPAPAPDPQMLSLSALRNSSMFTPALVSGLPTPSASNSSASSAGPYTPPPIAHPAILDGANVGFAAVHPPPLVPTKLYAPMTILAHLPPIKMAPGYRFLDRNKRDTATRQCFADKLRRV